MTLACIKFYNVWSIDTLSMFNSIYNLPSYQIVLACRMLPSRMLKTIAVKGVKKEQGCHFVPITASCFLLITDYFLAPN